jgi:phospholipid/cholesterol/gamma-HCH transport system substrate-binding protein
MDLHYKREITVGGLVLLAIVLFIAATMWLRGKSFNPGEIVRIQFENIGNLKEASAVRISGVEMGKVQSINFIRPGEVLVEVALSRDLPLQKDAKASIFTVSLAAGDAAIALEPGDDPEPLPADAIIMGTSQLGITDLAGPLAARADTILSGFQAMVSPEMTEALGKTMTALQQTLAATQQTMALYSNPNAGPSAELTRTLAQFRQLSAQLDSVVANPGLKAALDRSDSLTQSLQAMSNRLAATGDELQKMLNAINRGEGTLGKFMTDSTLYYGMVRATAQLDSLMAAIRANPGKIPIQVQIF